MKRERLTIVVVVQRAGNVFCSFHFSRDKNRESEGERFGFLGKTKEDAL